MSPDFISGRVNRYKVVHKKLFSAKNLQKTVEQNCVYRNKAQVFLAQS